MRKAADGHAEGVQELRDDLKSVRGEVRALRSELARRGPPGVGGERGAFTGICFKCGKKGHRKEDCPKGAAAVAEDAEAEE